MVAIKNNLLNKFDLYKDTIASIKATVVTNKGGIPLDKINREYMNRVGTEIPYETFNYSCLNDFLKSISGLQIKNVNGKKKLIVTESNCGHIAKLVENQKNYNFIQQKKVNFQRNSNFFRRRNNSSGSRNSSRSDYGSEGSSIASRTSRQSSIDIKIDPNRKMKVICEPIAYHQQLIGDDFFLQLAIRELHANNLWRKHDKSAICSGLCISGQTIKDCVKRLSQIEAISNRIVIMLGAVDIYKGHSLEEMKKDYKALLDLCEKKFLLSKSAITLCTLPPLPNIPLYTNFDRLSTQFAFNNFIREIVKDSNNSYRIIDFYYEFCCKDEHDYCKIIDFDLYQIEARMVSGCSNPHVLWNKRGRNLAMRLLQEVALK